MSRARPSSKYDNILSQLVVQIAVGSRLFDPADYFVALAVATARTISYPNSSHGLLLVFTGHQSPMHGYHLCLPYHKSPLPITLIMYSNYIYYLQYTIPSAATPP